LAFVVGLLAPMDAARAVRPGQWVHQTEADFQAAELDHTVVTNVGRVELSRASDKLAELEAEDQIIYDVAVADGRTYLALGPKGELAEFTDKKKIESIKAYENEQVFCLAPADAGVWVGVSGKTSRLELHVDGQVTREIELPDVRYVWDIRIVDARLWVATGVEGRVLVIDLPEAEGDEPTITTALDTDRKNVLCLGVDGRGRVYAGTDGEGLVYRITPKPEADGDEPPFDIFVLYDAAEPEIGALLVKPDGTVYAGTADADQARPGRLAEAVAEEKGEAEQPAEQDEADDGEGDADNGEDGEIPPPPRPQPEPDPQADDDAPAATNADAPADADDGADGADEGAENIAEPGPMPQPVPAPDAEPAPPAQPQPRQYAALRKVVSQRLAQLRQGQQVQPGANAPAAAGNRLSPRRPGGGTNGGQQAKEGNAVYEIATDGFVREVFRESVMILRIVEHEDRLIITTGNEGQVYRVDPATGETTVIADLEAQQIPAMSVIDDRLVIGTANPAQLAALGAGYAQTGTFTADPLDATQPSMWGRLHVLADTPEGTTVSISTRSGNIGDADAAGWSAWTHARLIEPEAEGEPVFAKVDSPTARFIQYRLTLTSEGDRTPGVAKVALMYLVPNMNPTISSLKATYPDPDPNAPPKPLTTVNIEWQATDPNNDTLEYKLELRQLGDDQPFIELADGLTGGNYEWDTTSTPDGRYKLRLSATDAPDNVPDQVATDRRLSSVVVVDNTAPRVSDFTVQPGAEPGTLRVSAKAADAISVISQVRYAINGSQEWQAVLPDDLIYDSTSETVSFTIPDLSPGRTVVGVRVTDRLGNSRFVSAAADVAGD